jgi:transcriptional regulator with XRE-family HTH domain
METSKMNVKKIWFKDDRIYILTETNQEVSQSLQWYPRLRAATNTQRKKCRQSALGLHWDDLDEDISFDSFQWKDMETNNPLALAFSKLPELNRSKVAASMGIPQSTLASYINGTKIPSESRLHEIQETLHKIGKELMDIEL